MRILTATQADNVALESKQIKQGLLTYALVHDGLVLGRADFKPEDKAITLAEWLAYGVDRVPKLYEEIKSGKTESLLADGTRLLVYDGGKVADKAGGQSQPSSGQAAAQIQQPALFDFSRKRRDVVLIAK